MLKIKIKIQTKYVKKWGEIGRFIIILHLLKILIAAIDLNEGILQIHQIEALSVQMR